MNFFPVNSSCTWRGCPAAGQKWRRSGLVETLWPITLTTRVRFPVGAGCRKKFESVWGNFYLPSPTLHARYGGIQKGLVGTCKSSVFLLFPVTRHNKKLVEVQTWTEDQLHTLQYSPHTCIHRWREGIKESCIPSLKNSRGYEACSKMDGLVESSITDCGSMSPSNVTSNTASKSNWRWPGAQTGRTGRRRRLCVINSWNVAECDVKAQ